MSDFSLSAGETDIAIALGTLDYLDTETDYVPWEAAALQLGKLKTRLSNTDGYGALMVRKVTGTHG